MLQDDWTIRAARKQAMPQGSQAHDGAAAHLPRDARVVNKSPVKRSGLGHSGPVPFLRSILWAASREKLPDTYFPEQTARLIKATTSIYTFGQTFPDRSPRFLTDNRHV